MSNLVFANALGKVGYYATLPASSDALIAVPIEATGIVSDSTMKGYTTLADLLAGASNEQTTMGRKTLASVSYTPGEPSKVDANDVTWDTPTGNATAALVICYVPDTGSSTDSNIIPLLKFDFAATPTGGPITYIFNSNGFYTAGNAS